jgi:hypothetical protein
MWVFLQSAGAVPVQSLSFWCRISSLIIGFLKQKKTSLIVLNKRERTCFHNYRACESSLSDVLSEEGAPNTPSRRLTDDLPWIFAEWPVL